MTGERHLGPGSAHMLAFKCLGTPRCGPFAWQVSGVSAAQILGPAGTATFEVSGEHSDLGDTQCYPSTCMVTSARAPLRRFRLGWSWGTGTLEAWLEQCLCASASARGLGSQLCRPHLWMAQQVTQGLHFVVVSWGLV